MQYQLLPYVALSLVYNDAALSKIGSALSTIGATMGIPYGTVLGSYFAVMFPDRVECMILDANIDLADYRDGTYGDNIVDTDKTFYAFLEARFENKDGAAHRCCLSRESRKIFPGAEKKFVTVFLSARVPRSSFLMKRESHALMRTWCTG